jgi:hypothetical protein
MVLGIILEKRNGGPSAWTRGPLARLWFTVHGGPRTGTVAGAHRSAVHRRSRARDLTMMVREARGGDGDLYPSWHETAEGPRWRAMVDRGGNQCSSMRGHSRCRREERRGAVGMVWRCGDGGAFYRVGEAVVGRGDVRPSDSWRCAIKAPVTRRGDDGVAMIHGQIEEELVARWFSSIWLWKGVHRR